MPVFPDNFKNAVRFRKGPHMFPPAALTDIEAYDHAEVIEGYHSHERDDPIPGTNHSDGFRWGWQNAHRDLLDGDDGFDTIRRLYIASSRRTRTA